MVALFVRLGNFQVVFRYDKNGTYETLANSRFLAYVKLLRQDLDDTEFDNDVGICSLLNG